MSEEENLKLGEALYVLICPIGSMTLRFVLAWLENTVLHVLLVPGTYSNENTTSGCTVVCT
jgi:hypothetical protein